MESVNFITNRKNSFFKQAIKKFIRLFGFEIYRLPTKEQIIAEAKKREEAKHKRNLWLKNMGIKTILDIGANTGQFAHEIREIFPEAMLYSFEPLPDCYENMVNNFKNIDKFQGFNLALGNKTGQIPMYHNEFTPSSSLLKMEQMHKDAFPFSDKPTTLQMINMVRLDDIASKLEIHEPMLIKMDVQGYEDQVIEGGVKTISQADILIIELSMETLYECQPLFDDIYKILSGLGFQYRGSYSQLRNHNDGSVLQEDGIFIKL